MKPKGSPIRKRSPVPVAAHEKSSLSLADQMESTTEQSLNELWISTLGLFRNDQQVLNSDRWLNDNIIYATERLLCQQSKDANIYGWQSPQCVKTTFKAIPPSCKYIQVLNVHESHWITISNIDVREDKCCSNVVSVYDSNSHARLSLSTKKQICSIVKPTCKVMKFDVMNTMSQPNAWDCGVFALACATDLAHGRDPVLSEWKLEDMRRHLVECLEKGHVSPFPTKKKRRIPLGSRVRRSTDERIYCTCRMPNDKNLSMISCKDCKEWYHENCLSIDVTEYKDKPWMCQQCCSFIESLR